VTGPRWLCVAALVALCACAPATDDDAEAPTPAPPVARVVPAERGPIAAGLTATGETIALRTVRLASPVSGRVTALDLQPGDRVAAQALAARVRPIENEAAVQGLDVMRGGDGLAADERPLADRLTRDLAGRDIVVRVPFAGIVADRQRNPGELVAANDVLLEIFDPASLVVIAQVPFNVTGKVRPGQRVELYTAGVTARGTVAAVLPGVTAQSLTVPVRIALAARFEPALVHAAVEARIITDERLDALLIPLTALRSADGDTRGTVVVIEGDRAVYRPVQLGLRDAEHVEIVDGLAPGELVVADGGYTLPNGARILPQPPGS
jgi:multidrug efflux pump subunit AcrA (membrane-fusion protein)